MLGGGGIFGPIGLLVVFPLQSWGVNVQEWRVVLESLRECSELSVFSLIFWTSLGSLEECSHDSWLMTTAVVTVLDQMSAESTAA